MKSLVGNVLYGFDFDVTQWIKARLPHYRPDPGAKALGVVRNGELVAGVAYEQYNGVHCVATIAVDHPMWATKSTMFHIFWFPFGTLECEAVSVLVPITNLQSLNLATKMGFEREAIIKYAAPDGSHMVVLKMFRDQCRWIRHGQGSPSPESAGSV